MWKRFYLDPATCSCENEKYLASIMNDSAIMCDEIIDVAAKSNDEDTKNIPTNFNEKKVPCKTQNFYILIAFLLIAIALLIVVSVQYYLMKYQGKQKHLLSFQSQRTN